MTGLILILVQIFMLVLNSWTSQMKIDGRLQNSVPKSPLTRLTVLPPAGHSHQLFHISAVVGTHFQMEGVITDMVSRRALFVAQGATASLQGTVGALVLGLLLNLGVIGVFSAPLLRKAERGSAPAPPQARCERREQ